KGIVGTGLGGGQDLKIVQPLILDPGLIQGGVGIDYGAGGVHAATLATHDQIEIAQADVEVDDDGFMPAQGESGTEGSAGSGFANDSLAGSNNEDLGQDDVPLIIRKRERRNSSTVLFQVSPGKAERICQRL